MFTDIDLSKKPQKPKLALCKPNKSIICNLPEAYSIYLDLKLTGLSELSLNLPYNIDKNHELIRNPHVDKIKNRYLIKMILGELIQYFVIDNPAPSADDNADFLVVNCFSLEHELRDKYIREYKADSIKLVSTTEPFGVMNIILKNTQWTMGDYPSVCNSMYRSFEVSAKTKLDFIQEIADKYSLVVQFDSNTRKVNFYEIDNVGVSKGLRISDKTYLRTITQNLNSDDFCTRLKVYGKDGLTIDSVNTIGQSYLEDYSYFLYPFQRDEITREVITRSDYMSNELCHALLDYQILLDQNKGTFSGYLAQLTTYQTTLTTLNNEMAELVSQMKIIDTAIETAQKIGNSTTALKAQKVDKQAEIDAKQLEIDAVNAQITDIQTQMNEINTELSDESYFADKPALLEERIPYIIEKEWTNNSYFLATDLYFAGLEEMNKRKYPQIIIEISIVNFLEIISEQRNWNKINIGDSVAIRHEQLGIDITAKIIECNFDFEEADIRLTISNIKGKAQTISDLIYTTTSAVEVIDIGKSKWNKSLADAKDYIDLQIQEMDGTLLNLGIDIQRFMADGFITKDESKALKVTLLQAISESQDPLNIAYDLEITIEADNYKTALTALETELMTKWIDQPIENYPIPVLTDERALIETMLDNVGKTKSILSGAIGKARQDDGKKYVEDQVKELNTALSAFQLKVNEYIGRGKITEAESNILDTLFVAVQTESDDIVAIADGLKPIIDGTDLTNLSTSESHYVSAINDALGSIDDWLDQISSHYPIKISTSKGKTVNNYLKKVEIAKEILNALIIQIRADNQLTYADQQIFEANVAIVSMQADIKVFAKGNLITYDESVSLGDSFDKILAESLDVINIANSMSVSPTLINNYQNSLTGTLASCGVDGLQVELNKWVGLPLINYPKVMKSSQRDAFLNKFKLVMSTKLTLSNAITLATPEYSVDGEIFVRGTGANHNSARVLKINKKNISASGVSGTGLMLTVISREDLSIVFTQRYDTFADDSARTALATKLDTLDDTVIVILTSYNSIGWNQTLINSMVKCGGSGIDTGTGKFPYAFVGIPGLFKGTALEVFSDSGVKSPYAEISTKIVDGTPYGIAIGNTVISAEATLAVQKAIVEADAANIDLGKVAQNTTVTSSEKKTVKKYWDNIVSEKSTVESSANYYDLTNYPTIGSTLATYLTSYTNLSAYITPILSVMTTSSTIVSATFINTFKAYYDAKIALLKAIMGVARDYIGDAVAGLAESLVNMNLEINKAFDDSRIYENEANDLASDLAQIVVESAPFISLAGTLGLNDTGPNEKVDYKNAIANLTTELNLWIGKDSSVYPIDVTADQKTAVRDYFEAVKSTKALLYAKISTMQAEIAVTNAAEQISTFASEVIDPLQAQVDGNIDIWFNGYSPTLDNSPANKWVAKNATTSKTLKDAHLGDLFYNTASGLAYKFTLTGSTYSWTQVTDADIVLALQQASTAPDTTDGTRRVFVSNPAPPYNIGDLWSQGVSGDMMICIVKRMTGSLVMADWVKSSKYTDDTAANNALALAEQARSDASTAMSGLAEVSSDNKVTPSEKTKTVKPDWDNIASEKYNIDAQADLYGISRYNYDTSYTNLYNYLFTYVLNNLTVTSTINRADFNSYFNTYYSYKVSLLKSVADYVKSETSSATSTANWAATQASTAVSSASTANALLADIANDNKLTPSEKQTTLKEWSAIAGEYSPIISQANNYFISYSSYSTAYSNLSYYLYSYPAVLSSLSSTSDIVGDTFRGKFTDYYNAKIALLNAIAAKISVSEVYIPLYYPDSTSYVSTTAYDHDKVVRIGSTTVDDILTDTLTYANVLHVVSAWPQGTRFAFEAVLSAASGSYCFVDLLRIDKNWLDGGVGSVWTQATVYGSNTAPAKWRSGTFSLATGDLLGVGFSSNVSSHTVKLYRADLIVIPK